MKTYICFLVALGSFTWFLLSISDPMIPRELVAQILGSAALLQASIKIGGFNK